MKFRSFEQSKFSEILTSHVLSAEHPLLLEGGTGLGKTRAYLHALISSGKRVAVILPTHQLIDQLLASSDLIESRGTASVVAFRPAGMWPDREAYQSHKNEALEAQVLLCTAASVLIDQQLSGEYNGVTRREYLLFDEADQLPDLAALQANLAIPAEELTRLKLRGLAPDATVSALLALPPRKVGAELRAVARVIRDVLENPVPYCHVGVDEEGGLALKHKLPGRLLKKISNRPNVAFVSATLSICGKFTDFQRAMGIEAIDDRSALIEPANHGTLSFFQDRHEIDSEAWISAILEAAATAARPTLIVTPSHLLAKRISAMLPNAVLREETETTSDAAARVAEDGVLIAAAAWAGLDTPLRWRSIIIPQVPYPQLQTINGEVVTPYLDSRNSAVRRLKQVLGRGLRTPDAECEIYILDERVGNLNGFIPERFRAGWEAREWLEGGRRPLTLSAIERDHRYRAQALRHYGRKCMALGCTTKVLVDSQLDVHHRFPLWEGVRKTKIEDLMVLCASCHRLAHTRTPPYQLDIEPVLPQSAIA